MEFTDHSRAVVSIRLNSVDITDRMIDRGLYNAIAAGEVAVLERYGSELLFQKTPLGNTTLHVAVESGKMASVIVILQRCPSLLRCANDKGDTPLHVAAKLKICSIAELLINHEKVVGPEYVGSAANEPAEQLVRMANKARDTALHEAVRRRDSRMVKFLTEADSKFEYFANNAGETPLYLAAESGCVEIVKQILETCPSTAHSGPKGMNALHAAILDNNSDVVELLLHYKRSCIKEATEMRRTPLHIAAYFGFEKRVAQLLGFDRTVAYVADKDGLTPLHMAASKDYIGIVKEIAQHCPDSLEILDNKGQNFFHVAVGHNSHKVVDHILRSKKIVVGVLNEPDNDGNTPLHLAAISKHFSLKFKLELDGRVFEGAINKKNMTAQDITAMDNPLNERILRKDRRIQAFEFEESLNV